MQDRNKTGTTRNRKYKNKKNKKNNGKLSSKRDKLEEKTGEKERIKKK